MAELSCRTARLWLQAPQDLPAAETRLLNEHLLDCAACYQHRKAYREVDRLIQGSLDPENRVESVRPVVRARLEEMQRTATRSAGAPLERPADARGLAARLLPRPAWIAASVAVTTALLALLASHLSPNGGLSPQTALSGWRLVRSDISYPLTVDPRHSDHLLAGAWGQIYESRNAGNSWRRLGALPPHLEVRDLAIDLSQPTRYLVATRHSIYVSVDAGRHWRMTASALRGARNMFLMQDPRVPATFYVGPSILWKSTNHGNSWTRAGKSSIFAPYGIQALAAAPDGALYTGIWGGGVAVSHDGGRTWQRRAQGLRRNVLNVTVARNGTLWAATDRGAYFSTDRGEHWRPGHLPDRFLNTSVIDGGAYLLAAGNGALYRSSDGGAHWHLSMEGLPLDPYIYGLVADPHHAGRVYASLNSDGLFRSDDAGKHWKGIGSGLPMKATGSARHLVLFERGGGLWITDSDGTDPGVLTVDRDVKLAALSPDGAAVAYVGADASRWRIRILSAGGSAARTLVGGSGSIPHQLLWSPNSSLLASMQASTVSVTNLSHGLLRWSIPAGERLVGWSPDGHGLLFWNGSRIVYRSPTTGQAEGQAGRVYVAPPLPAPDGKHIALISQSRLLVGTWWEGTRAAGPEATGCRLRSWSGDSTRLLLSCGADVQARTVSGMPVARAVFPAAASCGALPGCAAWVPGSNSELLFFGDGRLWRWTPGKQARVIVRDARPVTLSSM